MTDSAYVERYKAKHEYYKQISGYALRADSWKEAEYHAKEAEETWKSIQRLLKSQPWLERVEIA